ncbi:MAG TPA: nitrate- and nitrite sensing domain-containing protein [Actinophytocola sp.]|uniref:sensor histidine kinase n=1 Tax=Actinophytocola sp. TaxID=1872138 RepID=UPI002DDD8378|nr:nitrate- and nitrite sensing domain-containing protein [Actinophytocola sp.]HEV2781010.1 nitrate- and nitrite sensing domain-containing protein [Actinophytocola sp.]
MTESVRPIVPGPEMPSETEDGPADSGGGAPSLASLLVRWRDWNIPTKLAAVTLVPVVFAIVLGAMQIGDQVERADSYRRVDRLVTAGEQLRPLVDALQRERTATTALLAAGRVPEPAGELADAQRAVNTTRDALLRAARRASFHNEITSTRFAEVSTQLAGLPALREELAGGQLDAPAALVRYTAVIGALANFDRAAMAEVIDPALAATAIALHDLELAREEIRYQQALVGIGLARGGLTADELAALHASRSRLADRTAEFRLDATPAQRQDYARLVAGPEIEARENLAGLAAAAPPGAPVPVGPAEWSSATEQAAARLGALAATLGAQLDSRSTALQNEASDGAGVASVILLLALVVAGAVMIVIGRHLLRSLNLLRHSALDVAEHGLPDAVERIRDGGDGQQPVVEPVPVRSADEVGQVARAFDAVHRQALRLATEQAGLRARYGDVFVNLSRRSQGLVQRQLQLLERLERDEEDPEQLATLFQLDHLATRMRRNNENLMVLSGSELGRRNQRPATLADLLRAAVSEIEQYQRVVMLPPPDVRIVGYAVGDLVRLVAELLDNATAFSAPSTQVTIASHSFEDGSACIAVLDEGIGMSEAELAAANAKLADSRTVDVSTSRRMGLFVVGRLASRHGITVSLHGGKDVPGVRATVPVPAELVRANNPTEARTAEPPGPAGNGHAANGHGVVNGTVAPFVGGTPPAPAPPATNLAEGLVPNPLPRRAEPDPGPSTSEITRRLLGDDAPAPAPGDDPAGRPELPRRSPGSSRFVKPVDTAAGPVDLAMPGNATFPTSPADSLFTPIADAASLEETTPIFDEMISAWFRSITDGPDRPAPTVEEQWQFAADAGFLTAQAVSESQPDTFTESGLPRRNPRQNLVPGSATPPDPGQPAEPGRDPDELRDRLSSYQRAVLRARDERLVADDAALSAGGPPTLDLSQAGWRFAANPPAAHPPTSHPRPPDFTSNGLPRRAPRDTPGGADGEQPNRAEELRGRLGNFQRGLSRGRRSLAELAERAGEPGDEITAGARPPELPEPGE